MSPIINRLWSSPTFTTWASFAARTCNLVFILPLVLRQFSAEEIALWQVLSTLISLQLLADAGLGPTFARLISYAMAGVEDLSTVTPRLGGSKGQPPNWDLLRRICGTMRAFYARSSWIIGVVLLVGGTIALVRPIRHLGAGTGLVATAAHPHPATPGESWIAWGIVFVTTMVSFRANGYSAILQGTNHVALLRRWEALFGLGSIGSSAIALWSKGGLLALVISNQLWFVLGAWRNRRLARHVLDGRFNPFPKPHLESGIFEAAWPAIWRAGTGSFMAFGFIYIGGLLVAQSRDSATVASYLVAVRLVQSFSAISQAPFYTKLPVLSRLWAEGRTEEQLRVAASGMRLSLWTFVIPFILMGLFGAWGLRLIGSHTPFPGAGTWSLMGAAVLLERYGAMHLQLYSSTNRIVWHVANGVAGVIFAAVAFATYPFLNVAALPFGMLCGNAGFYAWYCSRLSHRAFSLPWPQFDWKTAGGPFLATAGYLVLRSAL